MSQEGNTAAVEKTGFMERLHTYYVFARPFTLVAPALGMVSGGVTAWGAKVEHWPVGTVGILVNIILGAVMAAMLNSASNGINQVYDLEVDRINKPKRMIPSGRMSIKEAMWVSVVFYLLALAASWFINIQCFILVLIAAILTVVYSVPPFRTKRWGLAANFTDRGAARDAPQGRGLVDGGVDSTRGVVVHRLDILPLPARRVDDEGLRRHGGRREGRLRDASIKYGVKKAAYIISPSFVLPFLLMPIGAWTGVLSGSRLLLTVFGVGLACWGMYVNYLILRRPEELATTENHISWQHMYLMMFAAQISFMVAYWWHPAL